MPDRYAILFGLITVAQVVTAQQDRPFHPELDPHDPPVVAATPEDPELRAATETARARFAEFRAAFAAREPGDECVVKRPFSVGEFTEHMWVEVTAIDGDLIRGTLSNEPRRLTELKLGDEVEVRVTELTDWMVVRSDGRLGGFSVTVFERRMANSNATVLRIEDPLPLARRLLRSSAFAETVQRLPAEFRNGMQARQIAQFVELFATSVPTRVELTMTRESVDQLGSLYEASMMGVITVGYTRGEEPKLIEARAALERALELTAEPLDLDLTIRITARTERTAESWFESALALESAEALLPGMVFRAESDDTVTFSLAIGDFSGAHREATVARVRGAMGEAFADEEVERVVAAFERQRVRGAIRLLADDAAIEVTIGDPAAIPTAARPEFVAADSADPLLYARWNGSGLFAHVRSMLTTMEEDEDAFDAMLAFDADSALSLMERLRNLADAPDRSEVALWIDDAAVRLRTHESTPLTEDDVTTLEVLPVEVLQDMDTVHADGEASFDWFAFDAASFVLSTAWELGETEFAEQVEPLNEYLASDDASRFFLGTLLVVDRSGASGSLAVPALGKPRTWTRDDEPIPAIALIGLPVEVGDGDEFVRTCIARLSGDKGAQPEGFDCGPARGSSVLLQALGLGVESAGDAGLHWCEHAETLVIATSRKLCTRLVEALAGDEGAALSATLRSSYAYSKTSGEAQAWLARRVADWIPPELDPHGISTAFEPLFRAIGEIEQTWTLLPSGDSAWQGRAAIIR